MSLKIVKRKQNGKTYLQIRGTIDHADGITEIVRQAPQTQDIRLARQEAAILERQKLNIAWHGERRGSKPFADAVESWLDSKERSHGDEQRLIRIVAAIGLVKGLGPMAPCSAIDQDAINEIKKQLHPNGAAPATITRGVIGPIRSVLRYAHRRGWCDAPYFEMPKRTKGKTLSLLPSEVRRMLAAAAPHLMPLIIFFVCTGARASEAIELDWEDVDLVGAKVTFWKTKNTRATSAPDRIADLPSVAVQTLTAWGRRVFRDDRRPSGRVFKWQRVMPVRKIRQAALARERAERAEAGLEVLRRNAIHGGGKRLARAEARGAELWAVAQQLDADIAAPRYVDYTDKKREEGGQFDRAFHGALRRAGLDSRFTPHTLRHTWASWHYAVHKDLLKLKQDGCWSSVELVERYAHLLPAGQEDEIRAFWAGSTNSAHDADDDAVSHSQ